MLALILALCAAAGMRASPADLAHSAANIAQLWQPPTDLREQDLFYGPWGAANAPDPNDTYDFVSKKKHGASPGLVVTDRLGRKWHVKQGREGPPEVVVSRVLSAVGYHQPPVYFLPAFRVSGRSTMEVAAGGRFRLSSHVMKGGDKWSWYQNPFIGTKPYRGLLVMLVLLNNADLKKDNNTVYELKRPREGASRWFVVRDLGTSLGAVGRFDPRPNDLAQFERHPFISGISKGLVRFDYGGVHADLVRESITTDDVRWAAHLLSGLTDAQWNDAFRAGGYSPETTTRYVLRIRQKIAEGLMVDTR